MLPPVEEAWCSYLEASTFVSYPPKDGDIRVTVIDSIRSNRVTWRYTILLELWANPHDSENDAIALHKKAQEIDSLSGLPAYITAVEADGPKANPDPDSELDRYQFLVSHNVRTI